MFTLNGIAYAIIQVQSLWHCRITINSLCTQMFILIIYLLFWTSDLISSSNELFSSPVGATFPFRFFLGASIEQTYSQISKNIQLLWQYTEEGGKYVSDIYIRSKYINILCESNVNMNVVHVFIKIVDSRKNNSVVYEFY